jgi:hypothetical protein
MIQILASVLVVNEFEFRSTSSSVDDFGHLFHLDDLNGGSQSQAFILPQGVCAEQYDMMSATVGVDALAEWLLLACLWR